MKTYPRERFYAPPDELIGRHKYTVDVLYDPDRVVEDSYTSDYYVKSRRYGFVKGVDVEGYHALVARGVLLPHTYFESFDYKADVAHGRRELMLTSGTTGEDLTSLLQDPNSYTLNTVSGADSDLAAVNIAMVRDYATDYQGELAQGAAANIYSKGFDVSTFVAELTDLRRMYNGLLDDVLEIKRTIRKKLKNPKKIIKFMEDAWLELRYGWRPLMHELRSLDSAIREFDENRKRWSERVGTTQRFTVTHDPVINEALGFNYRKDISDFIEVSNRGSVTADVMPEQFRSNPAETVWEKIPYSFVVDWFYSVGTAIQANSLLLVADAVVASEGFQVKLERTMSGKAENFHVPSTGNYYRSINTPGTTGTITAKLQQRVPCSVSTLPYGKVSLKDSNAIDLAALLDQAFGGNYKNGRW